MRTKEELIESVNAMPIFEYRDVALKVESDGCTADPSESVEAGSDGAAAGSSGISDSAQAAVDQDLVNQSKYADVPKHWTAIVQVGSNNPICFASSRYKLMQFKEAFLPLINTHADVNGKLATHRGFAVLDLFPVDESMIVPGPNGTVYKIGLSAYNSVDRTSALMIKFSVTDGNRIITFPKNVSSYYQAHVGQVKEKTDAYLQLMTSVRDHWPAIVNQLSSTDVTSELFDALTKDFKTDPQIIKALRIEIDSGAKYSLWSIMMEIYDRMQHKHSKSDVHLRKRLDEFISSVIDWSKMMTVLG